MIPAARPAKPASRRMIRWLIINWKHISPNCALETENDRQARLEVASQTLQRPVSTFSDLSMDEALQLAARWKAEMGEEFLPPSRGVCRRAGSQAASPALVTKLGELALELWGAGWDSLLRERLEARFRVRDPALLTPRQASGLAEELLQRIAVRAIARRHQPPISRAEIEMEKKLLRARFFNAGSAITE